MSIKGEEGVDELVLVALDLYRNIPRCFIRYLRVCCVRTPELAPLPTARSWEYLENDLLTSKTPSLKNQCTFDEAAYAHAMARQVYLLPVSVIILVCPTILDAVTVRIHLDYLAHCSKPFGDGFKPDKKSR